MRPVAAEQVTTSNGAAPSSSRAHQRCPEPKSQRHRPGELYHRYSGYNQIGVERARHGLQNGGSEGDLWLKSFVAWSTHD